MALNPKKINEFDNEPNPTNDFEFIGWEPEPTVPPELPAVGGAARNITLQQMKDILSQVNVHIGTEAPENPVIGMIWIDTTGVS